MSVERGIGLLLFAAALGLYLASLSWNPFPGLPAQTLLRHLGLETQPPALDALWGRLVRAFVRLPRLGIAAWTGLFSAFCGAASVGLLGLLMMRVSYRGWRSLSEVHVDRELQARRLSGLVAGLYLACCVPFWLVSTRSLPGSFHVLLLLMAVWTFSEYQRGGKLRHLFLLGATYGVGTTEFATFLLYLPLAIFLVLREWFRRRALKAWRPHLAFWSGLGLGLALYVRNAYALFRHSAPLGLFDSPWPAGVHILREQVWLITQMRYSPGFLVILFFSFVPWLVLFAMSRRSPWYYEADQVAVRVVFAGGLLGVLYGAPFAPWSLLGMSYLLVTPHVILAACMGYMAGEFWILGELQTLPDDSRRKRFARRTASAVALGLPLAIGLGGACNWRVVDGRHARFAETTANQVLDRLAGRDIVLSSGLLDDSLRLAIWARNSPVRLISAPLTLSPLYRRQLAQTIGSEALGQLIVQENFDAFLDVLLRSDEGLARVAILDLPDVIREYGFLVPDGFSYRLEPAAERRDLRAQAEAQRPFWDSLETWMAHPAPPANLARPYHDLVLQLAARVANNLGVLQAERGDPDGALATWQAARRIDPQNLSVLLNLLDLGRIRDCPDEAAWQADWEAWLAKPKDDRWALATRHGYVWQAREWARRGWVWALSGAPTQAEASRRQPDAGDSESESLSSWIDLVYLQGGAPPQSDYAYRSRLVKNGGDTEALLGLSRSALRRGDTEAAEAYLAEARAMGLAPDAVRFDQAMADVVRGNRDQALAALAELARLTPTDLRVWLALLRWSPAADPLSGQALNFLKDQRADTVALPLALAEVHLFSQRWAEAQAELQKALRLDPKNRPVWERLVTLAQIRDDRKLAAASLRTLLELDPSHPLKYLKNAFGLYLQGDVASAEAELQAGLRRERNPELLNALANIALEREGETSAACGWVEEALQKQPFNPIFLSTRGECRLRAGNLAQAEQDLRQALAAMPHNAQASLTLAEVHAARGDKPAALALARTLAKRRDDLSPKQIAQLKKLARRLMQP